MEDVRQKTFDLAKTLTYAIKRYPKITHQTSELRMTGKTRLLRKFSLTEVCDADANGAILVELENGFSYHRREIEITKRTESSIIKMTQFPIVFDTFGVPWADAIVYIILIMLDKPKLDKGTFSNIALDLATYRQFLDNETIDWTVFHEFSRFRPTYRFEGYLKLLAANQELANLTAKRTMNTMISYYRGLIEKGGLSLDFPPWEEEDVQYQIVADDGFAAYKSAKTTDISLTDIAKDAHEPDFIYDEGKLLPLSREQQEVIFETLAELGNIEVTLMHLIAIDTACRIQTVLTIKVKDIEKNHRRRADGTVLIPAGENTGIDTKFSTRNNIKLSCWILDLLILYYKSPRADKRRAKHVNKGGEVDYLFLTPAGNPFYGSKADTHVFEDRAYTIRGGALRKYVTDYVIPKMRMKLRDEKFLYRVHWLRATGGMIKADQYNEQVEAGIITRVAARDRLRRDMWHANSKTTDGYLDYRKILRMAIKRQEHYEVRLEKLMRKSMDNIF